MAGITRFVLLAHLLCTGVLANLDRWMGGGDKPWGDKTAKESSPQDVSITGVTRHYDFTISRITMAPDGVSQSLLVANGQFPGPMIEGNWGDMVEITVRNEIYGPEESTLIHWHGLNQPGTPWYDGVISVSQCPIVPGSSFTYRFLLDEFGTSWWHSHLSAQYTQGLFGPIVVHGPSEYSDYDEDLGPVLINDWYHDYYADIVRSVTAPVAPGTPPPIPRSQSNLVNGAGRFGCGGSGGGAPPSNAAAPASNITARQTCTKVPYTSWNVEAGKTYRMRLINAGSVGFEAVSIDGHQLTVIANDFVPVKPYDVDHVLLAVGQRVDVIFTATGKPGETYWFRAFNDPLCGQSDGPDGRGIISYSDTSEPAEPTTTATAIPPNTSCSTGDLSLAQPLYATPVEDPDVTFTLAMAPRPDADGVFKWAMNNIAFKGDAANPVLPFAITEDSIAFPSERNVYNLGSNKTIRVILQNNFRAPHPMHLHGHDFLVLAQGAGTWDGSIVRPSNPVRRDTQAVWGGLAVPAYSVIQWTQDNPGIWPLHCHIAWHLSGGMIALMLERPDELVKMDAELPDSIAETCAKYKPWLAANGESVTSDGLKSRNMRRWGVPPS